MSAEPRLSPQQLTAATQTVSSQERWASWASPEQMTGSQEAAVVVLSHNLGTAM